MSPVAAMLIILGVLAAATWGISAADRRYMRRLRDGEPTGPQWRHGDDLHNWPRDTVAADIDETRQP